MSNVSGKEAALQPSGASFSRRYHLIRLIEAVGEQWGLSRSGMAHLIYLIRHTQEVDWLPGNRVLVYKSVTAIARDHGVSERQIHNREQSLCDLLGLKIRVSGNFRRYGRRDAESGRILQAFGVDLAPLKALVPALESAAQAQEQERQQWQTLKHTLSGLRGSIRQLLGQLVRAGADTEGLDAEQLGFQGRVRAETPVSDLRRRVSLATRFRERLKRILGHWLSKVRPAQSSDRAEEDFRHSNPSNEKQTNDKSFVPPPPPAVGNRLRPVPPLRVKALSAVLTKPKKASPPSGPSPLRVSKGLPQAKGQNGESRDVVFGEAAHTTPPACPSSDGATTAAGCAETPPTAAAYGWPTPGSLLQLTREFRLGARSPQSGNLPIHSCEQPHLNETTGNDHDCKSFP